MRYQNLQINNQGCYFLKSNVNFIISYLYFSTDNHRADHCTYSDWFEHWKWMYVKNEIISVSAKF